MSSRCVDIVVGLAAGSEGKGKIVSMLQDDYKALVRTGGPNAAHTVIYKGKPVAFHIIPCGSLHFPDAKLIMGAGAQIDVDHLKHEIEILKEHGAWLDKYGNPRLIIDPHATVIDPIDKIAENGGRMPDCGELYFKPRECKQHTTLGGTCVGCEKLPPDSAWKALGSTTHGSGANAIRKSARGTKMAVLPGQALDLGAYFRKKVGEGASWDEIAECVMATIQNGVVTDWGEFIEPQPVRLASEDEFLKQFIVPTALVINRLIDENQPVMLEGTQGSLLSLHHSYWPKATSRDTNAANWCADAGVSPLCVRDVYGVTRTFPIRVAGKSGPLSGTEISWEEVTEHATGKPVVEMKRKIDELDDMLKTGKRVSDPDSHDDLINGQNIRSIEKELVETIDQYKSLIIEEVTTATKRRRRVFTFGEDDFKKSIAINRPTCLALTFVDYLNIEDKHKSSWDSLSSRTQDWITTLESKLGVFFKYLSTGPDPEHTIIRKSPQEVKDEMGVMAATAQAGHRD